MTPVAIDDVRRTLEAVIVAGGVVTGSDAAILADEYLESELQGKPSHGVAAFVRDVPKFSEPAGPMEVVRESDAALYIDAHREFGALVWSRTKESLIAKAAEQGVAIAFVRDMRHWLRPSTIAEELARRGLVGIVVNTGGPRMVAPPGGFEPAIGTNPIGVGIPAGDEQVIADMATSTRAWGVVREAQSTGEQLPRESFYDAAGDFAVEPDAAHSAVPMADHKGFALGLLIEVLGGSFVGMPMGSHDVLEPRYPGVRGAAILMADPDFTVGAENFGQDNRLLFERIRSSATRRDTDGVTLPGDRAGRRRRAVVSDGSIDLDDGLWATVRNLA